eukprot:TRINITY_DN11250_c0_g1_i2.p1 TRINITY_DN11250_c0_g1~~TRINITY_DN11250_c0_g1_i2.p1  ORF type:complete len:281 (-),score=21.81 TRINITY_DN11250_c0_g1_i2:17-832(-)
MSVIKAPPSLSHEEPGPGDFKVPGFLDNEPTSPRSATFSIASDRRKDLDPEFEVATGPGSYSITQVNSSTISRHSGHSFGKSSRMRSTSKASSNSTFMAPSEMGCSKASWRTPQVHFGTARRFPTPRDGASVVMTLELKPMRGLGVPGPGYHNPEDKRTSKWTSDQTASFGARLALTERAQEPGPGDFGVRGWEAASATLKSPRSNRFGRSTRFDNNAGERLRPGSCSPGPGMYDNTAVPTRRGGPALGSSGAKWSMSGRAERQLTFSTCV